MLAWMELVRVPRCRETCADVVRQRREAGFGVWEMDRWSKGNFVGMKQTLVEKHGRKASVAV